MKRTIIQVLGIGIITVIGFVFLSHMAQQYSGFLQTMITHFSFWSVLLYIGLLVVAIVVAPISTGFLLPIAANGWGPMEASLYSIIGWTLGSIIAFWISRRYGFRWASRFATVKKLQTLERALPRQHVFVIVVLLRMALPVDVLSYALGIFSSMRWIPFIATTVIGVTPFTILLTYASVGSTGLQVIVGVLAVMAFLIGAVYLVYKSTATQVTAIDTSVSNNISAEEINCNT